ncbi:MAG: galactose/methyl galactoside ABC transporter permease MglC [Erysipelotrichaceae bacterium]
MGAILGNLSQKQVKDFILDHALHFILIAMVIGIIIINPRFLNITNLRNILTQSSFRVIIALGLGGLLITQGNDLSAGRQVGLAAVISASLLQAVTYTSRMYPTLQELPLWLPIIIVMIVGGFIGLLNGVVVAVFKVTPFIATLGMQLIIYGVSSMYVDRPPLGAQPIGGLDTKFLQFGTGSIGTGDFRIPYAIIYAIIAIIIISIIWNKTKLGKNMYAIGGNPEAAAVSGVNIVRNTIAMYVIAGMLFAFAGTIVAAQTGSATNNTGTGYELDAIAACVVGGVSFSGGIGTVRGVVVGVLLFQLISYGLVFIKVNPYIQMVVKGLIIIVAVAIDGRKYLKKK